MPTLIELIFEYINDMKNLYNNCIIEHVVIYYRNEQGEKKCAYLP